MTESQQRVVYLNGRFQSLEKASVPVQDRGFLFGDGVYEVVPVFRGKPFHLSAHLKRLKRSLSATGIPSPMADLVWLNCIGDVIEQNGGGDLSIYIQVTRGVGPRDLAVSDDLEPTVLVMPLPLSQPSDRLMRCGYSAITQEDFRWQHCDLKTTSLIANVMLKKIAAEAEADEVILVRDGFVTEGVASNLFVAEGGKIYTAEESPLVLPGITREVIVSLCRKQGIPVVEGPLPLERLASADEVWATSSTMGVMAVTKVDGAPVGSGKPGTLWAVLHAYYAEAIGRVPQDYGAALRQVALQHHNNLSEQETVVVNPIEEASGE
ncbi:MAG: aminotransferase class IV [bacterium]